MTATKSYYFYQAFIWSLVTGGMLGLVMTAQVTAQTMQLSLQDCIQIALQNNSTIMIKSVDQLLARTEIETARAMFDPQLAAEVDYADSRTRQTIGDVELGDTGELSGSVGMSGYSPYGTTMGVVLDNAISNTGESIFSDGTSYATSLSVSVTQPILKGRKPEVVKAPIVIAQRNLEISNQELSKTLADVVTNVENLYWDLVFARRNLEVTKDSRELAKKQRERSISLIEAGKVASIEQLAADAAVAAKEESIILAEQAIAEAEDLLRQALWLEVTPTQWQTTIIPIDEPVLSELSLNETVLYQQALTRRPEVAQLSETIAINELGVVTANDSVKPDLKAITQISVGGAEDDYGEAISEMAQADRYSVLVGVKLSTPWFNKAARSSLAKNQLRLQQNKLQMQVLQDSIRNQIRSAVRSVQSAQKRIAANESSVALAQRRLEAEERQFELGRSTNIDVLNAQNDYNLARTALLKAFTDYRKAIAQVYNASGSALSAHEIAWEPSKEGD